MHLQLKNDSFCAFFQHPKDYLELLLTVVVQVEVVELSSGRFLSDVSVDDVGAELVQRDGVAQRLAEEDQLKVGIIFDFTVNFLPAKLVTFKLMSKKSEMFSLMGYLKGSLAYFPNSP